MSFKLIISIVPHQKGEVITDSANQAGAQGGTILMGRGTAENGLLQLLGFGDTKKDITYNIVSEELVSNVISKIVEVTSTEKKHFGVLFTLELNDFVKAGTSKNECKGENKMESISSYQMINVIVNKGFAEDAMAAARKAGAGGGTIIGARGTAKEDDAKFFGMTIVPEKDLLMILVPSDKKESVVEAIKSLSCFEKAGSGIIFCNEANNFTLLGKN